MKRLLTISIFTLLLTNINAQYRLVYESFSIGSIDTSVVEVTVSDNKVKITPVSAVSGKTIPGTAKHTIYVDYGIDSAYTQLTYSDTERYFTVFNINNGNDYTVETPEKTDGYKCEKRTTSLFSNRMEIWTTKDLGVRATPSTAFANIDGVVVRIMRNGNHVTRLKRAEKIKPVKNLIPANKGKMVDSRTLNNIEKEKLVITIPVFDDAQICFNPALPKPHSIPYDTTLSFSNGTVVLKRMNIDRLPDHYQFFAEITERSNGDAYDRTGSIFVIPAGKTPNFTDALLNGIESLPTFTDRSGESYQGISAHGDYLPLVELVRFFTPFGVSHFNQYRSLPDREWEDAAYYKQDISDLREYLHGDVYIGAFIGNYDGGGHKLSMVIKAYPEDQAWTIPERATTWSMPLFNTCNVMEMSGQNYGRLFGTDSLTVAFDVPEGVANLRLRYISTGHGGWEAGDEFVPKENTILIDGKERFKHTPWRSDCGTFRAFNPASGNFWNGLSSSDYSRSGWCPGTATQPVYFDLGDLTPGRHTITVAIPQGPREGNSFSAWNVSGIITGNVTQ
ncbi:MAG: PNGase F N-terminal domain-containing protein [Bacteroidales bacterium]|nr:PNGase F N-terminal domain-containing protein [Bacteroidales bacterium]